VPCRSGSVEAAKNHRLSAAVPTAPRESAPRESACERPLREVRVGGQRQRAGQPAVQDDFRDVVAVGGKVSRRPQHRKSAAATSIQSDCIRRAVYRAVRDGRRRGGLESSRIACQCRGKTPTPKPVSELTFEQALDELDALSGAWRQVSSASTTRWPLPPVPSWPGTARQLAGRAGIASSTRHADPSRSG